MHLIVTAAGHPPYQGAFSRMPGTMEAVFERVLKLAKMSGPIRRHRAYLSATIKDFRRFQDLRHVMVHGLMVPLADGSMRFQTYQHRDGGQFGIAEMVLKIDQVAHAVEQLGALSSDFPEHVASLCREVIAWSE